MLRCLWFVVVLAALCVSGCAHRRTKAVATVQMAALPEDTVPSEWRSVARRADQAKLDDVAGMWSRALSQAARTEARVIVQEGALLRANAALPRALPTPGLYRCRSVRLGRPDGAPVERPLIRSKPFDCVISVEQAALGFTRVSGPQRPGGYLWSDGDKRMVFLGGTAERDGEGASAYAGDSPRNRFGIFERIGEFRWRLVLIGQPPGAQLDVIELIPAVAIAARASR